jgi:hypothetical protein
MFTAFYGVFTEVAVERGWFLLDRDLSAAVLRDFAYAGEFRLAWFQPLPRRICAVIVEIAAANLPLS